MTTIKVFCISMFLLLLVIGYQAMGGVPATYIYACKQNAPILKCVSMWNIYKHEKDFMQSMYPPEIVFSQGCRAGLMIRNAKGDHFKRCRGQVDRFVKTYYRASKAKNLLGNRYNKTVKLTIKLL